MRRPVIILMKVDKPKDHRNQEKDDITNYIVGGFASHRWRLDEDKDNESGSQRLGKDFK